MDPKDYDIAKNIWLPKYEEVVNITTDVGLVCAALERDPHEVTVSFRNDKGEWLNLFLKSESAVEMLNKHLRGMEIELKREFCAEVGYTLMDGYGRTDNEEE